MDAVSSAAVKSENQRSMKVLEELLSKLSVSKTQDEINSTSLDLASFINGDIVEMDAPTKYVHSPHPSVANPQVSASDDILTNISKGLRTLEKAVRQQKGCLSS